MSFIISFWVYSKELISGYPGFFIGTNDSMHGLNNIKGLWSNLNFGEPSIQNSWLVLLSKIYSLIRYLNINPFMFNSLICFTCLFLSYLFVKKNIDFVEKKNLLYVFFISTAYSFSTFSLVYFEQNTFFVYLYWLLPLKIYIVRNIGKNKTNRILNVLLIVLFSSINLPFGFFAELLSFTCLILEKRNFKEIKNYLCLSMIVIFIAILPSLFYTLLNISFTNGVLSSETFYRINTSASSLIRGITNWGFWGQYNGYLYRNYSGLFNTPLGYLTSFLFLVPLIIITVNKKSRFQNIIIGLLLILTISLIAGDKYEFTNIIISFFNRIPMSDIFRDNSKFYFLINSFILILMFYNRRIKVASIVWVVSVLPIIYIFIFGIILQPSTTNQNISRDYGLIHDTNLVNNDDNAILFPTQYMPVYKGVSDKDVKSITGYSRPEFFFKSNIVIGRCIGCGNPILQDDIKILTDIKNVNWVNKIYEFGITKLIFDNNINIKYYPATLSNDEFETILNSKNIAYDKIFQKSITIYSLRSVKQKRITACDPLWFRYNYFSMTRECNVGEKYFTMRSNSIFLPNLFMYMQIVLLLLLLVFIYKRHENI